MTVKVEVVEGRAVLKRIIDRLFCFRIARWADRLRCAGLKRFVDRFFCFRNTKLAGRLKFAMPSLSSLTVKATLFIILTCVVPLSIVGWYFIVQTTKTLTEVAVDRNNKVAERVASDIGNFVQNKRNFLMVTSSDMEIRSLDPAAAGRSLKKMQPYYGGNGALFAARRDGQQIARTDAAVPVNISDREYFQKALQGTVQFETVRSKVSKQLAIMGAMPVYGADNAVTGVLGATLPLSSLTTVVEQILSQNPGYAITVIDKNRVPLFYQGDSTAVEEQRQLTEECYIEAVEKMNGDTVAELRGQEYFISYRPVTDTDWVVVAAYPRQAALQSAYDMMQKSAVVMVAIILVFVVIGLMATRRALAPLKQLVLGTQTVAGGDLTHTLAHHNKDEFGNVAKAFNSMTGSLRQIVQSVKASSNLILEASGGVAASAEQSRAGSTQVALAVGNVAEKLVQQEHDTGATKEHLEQLVDTAAEVSGSIRQVADATNECSEMALHGQAVIGDTVTKMQDIKTLVDETGHIVESLNNNANEISQITDVITNIAKQTGLLALNAAIEAAHAGEQGRGFAVVADEVRKLADQSATAAKNISGIIIRVQSETNGAVDAMQQSLVQVDQGVDIAKTSGEVFGHIVAAIQHVQHQVSMIALQTEKQSGLCSNAMEAVARISELSSVNTNSVQEIASVCQEQAASAHDITHSIEKLKAMAHQLEEMVQQFRV